jgi:hypothetical protein
VAVAAAVVLNQVLQVAQEALHLFLAEALLQCRLSVVVVVTLVLHLVLLLAVLAVQHLVVLLLM